MVKPLSRRDFRAIRRVLEPRDYAIPGPRRRPADRIDPRTWRSIWNLPDSVAIDTTNDYGGLVRSIMALSGGWTSLFRPLEAQSSGEKSPVLHATLEAYDAFEASILNAVVGYYRIAFTALRSVVENMTISLHLELAHDRATFAAWLEGKDLRFGWAADNLRQHAPVSALESALARRMGNDLFRQSQPTRPPGHARKLFDTLSRHAHARPGFTDGDLWESNGPIFSPRVFVRWANTFTAVFALSLLLVRLAFPRLSVLNDERYRSLRDLFRAAVDCITPGAALRRALLAVPASTWS